jgi:phage baseplate assembly protein W
MLGLNRDTGGSIAGWDHVLQSLEVIFSTRFHERVMRQWFGSLISHMLGENITERNLLKFFYSVALAIELWEPRFRLVKIDIKTIDRAGTLAFQLNGLYFPEALNGNYQTQIRRSLVILARQSGLVVEP